MHYLITGGAGFIGSHLCETLIRNGHSVTAIDNLSSGSQNNVQGLLGKDSFKVCYRSLLDIEEEELAALISDASVVVHLAASVGVESISRNYINTIRNNFISTETMLRICARQRKRFVMSSTSEVYGNLGTMDSFNEENAISLQSPLRSRRGAYACSKALGEYLALSYHDTSELPVTVVRIFNATGPRQSADSGMVVPRFVTQAIKNEPLTIFGNGLQSRCFSHVQDVCNGIIALCENPDTAGEIYNIGNDREISILDLARSVVEITGSSSTIGFAPQTEGRISEIYRRVPDLSKIKSATGYQPSLGIAEIISDVSEYMRQKLGTTE
jgi:UDP-glucose 4-epimerase